MFQGLRDEPFDLAFIDYREALAIPLYRKMFHPELDNLFFIGLFQPLGCIWPLADHQARLAVKYMQGKWKRPVDMRRAIARELGLSRERVRQLEREALDRLEGELVAQGVEDGDLARSA